MANVWTCVFFVVCVIAVLATEKIQAEPTTPKRSEIPEKSATRRRGDNSANTRDHFQAGLGLHQNIAKESESPSLSSSEVLSREGESFDGKLPRQDGEAFDGILREFQNSDQSEIHRHEDEEGLRGQRNFISSIQHNDRVAVITGHGALSWLRKKGEIHQTHIHVSLSLMYTTISHADVGDVILVPVHLNFGDGSEHLQSLPLKVEGISAKENYIYLTGEAVHQYKFLSAKDSYVVSLQVCCRDSSVNGGTGEASLHLNTTVGISSSGSPIPPPMPVVHLYQASQLQTFTVNALSIDGHPLLYKLGHARHTEKMDSHLPADSTKVDSRSGEISIQTNQVAVGVWNLPVLIEDVVTGIQSTMEVMLHIHATENGKNQPMFEPTSPYQIREHDACIGEHFQLDMEILTDSKDGLSVVPLISLPDELQIRTSPNTASDNVTITSLTWQPKSADHYSTCLAAVDAAEMYSVPWCVFINVQTTCEGKAPAIDLNGPASTGSNYQAMYTPGKVHAVPITSVSVAIETGANLQHMSVALGGIRDTGNEILVMSPDCYLDRKLNYHQNDEFSVLFWEGEDRGGAYIKALSCLRYVHTLRQPTAGKRFVLITVKSTHGLSSRAVTEIDVLDSQASLVSSGCHVDTPAGHPVSLFTNNEMISSLLPGSAGVVNMTLTLMNVVDGEDEMFQFIPETEFEDLSVEFRGKNHQIVLAGSVPFKVYTSILKQLQYLNKAEDPIEQEVRFLSIEMHTADQQVYENSKVCEIRVQPLARRFVRSVNSVTVTFTEENGPVSIPVEDLGILEGYNTSMPTSIEVSLRNRPDADQEILAVHDVQEEQTFDVGGRQIKAVVTYTPLVDLTDGLLNISGLETVEEFDAVLKTLTYDNLNTEPNSDTRVITIQVNDGVSYSAVKTVYVDFEMVNDSPYFNSNERPKPSTLEDAGPATQVPMTTLQLAGSIISDEDGDDPGIAVIGVDNSHGYWEYLDFPGTWTVIDVPGKIQPDGTVHRNTTLDNLAMVLRSEWSNFIRFIPEPDWHGTSYIAFVAWDGSGGSGSLEDGEYINATSFNDTDPFSVDVVTIALEIYPVNDNPVLDPSVRIEMTSIKEDATAGDGDSVQVLLSNCSDVDISSEEELLGVAIIAADLNNGQWQYSLDDGMSWTEVSPVTADSALLLGDSRGDVKHRIRFIPNPDWNGVATLTFKAWDFSNNLTAGMSQVDTTTSSATEGAFSISEGTAVLTVEPVNDSPILKQATFFPSVREDVISSTGTVIIQIILWTWSDVDVGDVPGAAVVATDNRFGYWQYTCDGGYPFNWVNFTGSYYKGQLIFQTPNFEAATLLSATCRIRFIPQSNFNTQYDSNGDARPAEDMPFITILAWDQSGETSTMIGQYGVDVTDHADDPHNPYSSEFYNVTLEIQSSNDRPIMKVGGIDSVNFENTFMENSYSVGIVADDLVLYDVDSSRVRYVTVTIAYDFASVLGLGYPEVMDCEGATNASNAHEQIYFNVSGTPLEATVQSWCPFEIKFAHGMESLVADFITVMKTLQYANTKQEPHPADRIISFRVRDTYTYGYTVQTTVHMQLENDAPVLVLHLAGDIFSIVTYTEGQGELQITPDLQLTDSDSPYIVNATIKLANFDEGYEILDVNTEGTGIDQTFMDGELTLLGGDTVANYSQVLRSLTYTNSRPDADYAERTVEITVNDGELDSETVECRLTYVTVNNPPVLTPIQVNLNSIREDDKNSTGNAVVDLLVHASDADNTVLGIALLDSDNDKGRWQYTLDGSNWNDIQVNGITDALLLTSLPEEQHRVRFLPDDNFHGESWILFKAWDLTSNYIDGATNMDVSGADLVTGAFSVNETFAGIQVESVNDSPVLLSGGTLPEIQEDIEPEDNLGIKVDNLLKDKFSDEDDDAVGIAVIGVDNRHGNWQYSCNKTGPLQWVDFIGDIIYGKVVPETPVAEKATLLSTNCSVRFQPQKNFNTEFDLSGDERPSSDIPAVTVLAWDNTGGTMGHVGKYGQDTTGNMENESEFSSVAFNFTVTVKSINDPPVLKLGKWDNFDSIFTEDGPAVHIVDLSELELMDIDNSYFQNIMVSIENVEDGDSETLTVMTSDLVSISNSQISVVYDTDEGTATANVSMTLQKHMNATVIGATTLTFTATGSNKGIPVQAAQTILRHILYHNSEDEPSNATRRITVKINDTVNTTSAVTSVPIQLIGDHAPEVVVPTTELNFTEGDSDAFLFPDLQLTDQDHNEYFYMASTVITIDPPLENTLLEYITITDHADLLAVTFDPTSGAMLISGTASTQHYQEALRSIIYKNHMDEPEPSTKYITVTVTDEDGFQSNTATVALSILVINDHVPVVSTGDHFIFTEDTDTTILLSDNLTIHVSDADSGNLPLHAVHISIENATDGDQEFLEVVTSGEISQEYLPDTHTLIIRGPADVTDYQQVLDTLSYTNTAEEPTPGIHCIQIIVSDGEHTSSPATISIEIQPVNDRPLLDLDSLTSGQNLTLTYTENSGSVKLLDNQTFRLLDYDDIYLQSAIVTLKNPTDGDMEMLHVTTTGTNIVIGNVNVTMTQISMAGEDTVEIYRQVLLSLRYENTNHNISPDQRVIQLQVFDGQVTSEAYIFINIIAVNDPPIIDLNGLSEGLDHSVNFTEEGDGVRLSDGIMVVDYDDESLVSAMVEITNPRDGVLEEIIFNTSLVWQLRLMCEYNNTTSQLIITGIQPVISYQRVFNTLMYVNYADEPNPETRFIKFLVYDGANFSEPALTKVAIILTNDIPVLHIAHEDTNSTVYKTTFIEDNKPVALVETAHTTVTDNDDATLEQLSVHIDNVLDQGSETLFFDLATLPTHINITKILSAAEFAEMNFQTCPDHLDISEIVIDYDFTLEEWTEILKSLRYCNRNQNLTGGEREIRMSLIDSQNGESNTCYSYVDVIPVNDPPAMTQPLAMTYRIEEDHNLTIPILPHFEDQEETLTSTSIQIVAAPDHGSVIIVDDINYYPEVNDYGNYTLTFQVCDSFNDCSPPIEIRIEVQSVNDPPFLVEPLQVSFDEDQPIMINLKQFVRDYEDDIIPGGAYPEVTAVDGPHTGTRAVSVDNRYMAFTPSPNFHGHDSITVDYCDSDGACLNDVVILIDVKSVNDLPVVSINYPGETDLFRCDEDENIQIEITVEDVEDRTPGNITILTVQHGVAEHNSTNQSEILTQESVYQVTTHIDYTPDDNYFGADEVIFEVCDWDGGCVNDTIYINIQLVNDPPVVGITTLHIREDETLTISVPADLNITDVDDDLDYSNIWLISNISVGMLSDDDTPTWWYQPPENFYSSQPDDVVFRIRVCDSDSADPKCTDADIQIVIAPVNDPPLTPAIQVQFDEDSIYTVNLSLYVSDVEDGPIDLTKIELIQPLPHLVNASYDSLTGLVTLTGVPDGFGHETVAYKACDSQDVCSEDGVIQVEVFNVNDPPVADDFLYMASQDKLQLISISEHIHDADLSESDKLTSLVVFLIDSQTGEYTEHVNTENGGTVKFLAQKQHIVLTYEPEEHYIGSDGFSYAVCDQCDERLGVVALTDTGCTKQVQQNNDSSTWPDGRHIACDHGNVEVLVLNSNEAPVVKDISASTVMPASVVLEPYPEEFAGLTTDAIGVYDPDDLQAALLLANSEDLQLYHLNNGTDINITSTTVVTQPKLGSVHLVFSDDSIPAFLYTPFYDQHGYDSFVFQICDQQTKWQESKCSWATAKIHVMIPGPNITALIASPAQETVQQLSMHTDCKFSRQDTITVMFDTDTNMPPYHNTDSQLTTRDLNTLFKFADPFITENKNSNPYVGQWVTPDTLSITIIDEGYPQPDVEIGKWFLSIKEQSPCGGYDAYSKDPLPSEMWSDYCLTSAGYSSAHSTSTSSPLQGSWGYHIPTVKDIIIRNDNVPMVKLRENSDYFGEDSELVLSLWPPLSYNQLLALCQLEPDEVLDLSVFGQGTELLKANCENVIPGESVEQDPVNSETRRRSFGHDEESVNFKNNLSTRFRRSTERNDSTTIMPVFTELVFEITKMNEMLTGPEADREHFINTISSSVRTDKIADIVSVLTGMIRQDVLNYTSDIIDASELAKLYQEYISDQTPQVLSVTANDPDNLDLEFSNGDTITVEFDRDTNSPLVETKEDLDRILTFDASLGLDYTGFWRTAKKLEILIVDSTHHSRDKRDLQNISFTFTHNTLYSGQEFTGQYPYLPTTRPNCVGVNVCGGNSSAPTVGICSEDGLSCRATGTYYISGGNFGTGTKDYRLWWIILGLIACTVFLALVFMCMYCCTKKKKKPKRETEGKIGQSSADKDTWPQKAHKEGQTGPGLIPPMILFKHQSKRQKVVDDVSKAEYTKEEVNVDMKTLINHDKNEDKDSTDLSVSAIFPDLRTALLLQPAYNSSQREVSDNESVRDPHSPSRQKLKEQPEHLVRHTSEIDMSILSHDDNVIPYYKTWHQSSVGQPPPDFETPLQTGMNRKNVNSTRHTEPLHAALLVGQRHNSHHTGGSRETIQNISVVPNHKSLDADRGTPIHSRSASVPATANTVSSEPAVAEVAAMDLSTQDANQRNLLQNHLWERNVTPSHGIKIGNGHSVFLGDLDIEREAKKREHTKGKLDSGFYPVDAYELSSIHRANMNGHSMYSSADNLHSILASNASQKDTSKF